MTRVKLLKRLSRLLLHSVHLLRRETNRIGILADVCAELDIRSAIEKLAIGIDQ